MSYLDYQERSFQSDSDDEDSDDSNENIFNKNLSIKRKKSSLNSNEINKPMKKPHFLDSDDDDNELKDDDVSSHANFQIIELPKKKNEEDIIKEKEKELKSKVLLEQISKKLKNNEIYEITDDDDDDDYDDDNNNNNDLAFIEAKKLKEAIELTKNVKNKNKTIPKVNDTRSKSPVDTFFIPTVKQTSERKNIPEMEFSINMLNDIIDFSTFTKNPIDKITSNNNSNNSNNPNQIKLKSRLNGTHEWKFMLSLDDTIGKVIKYINYSFNIYIIIVLILIFNIFLLVAFKIY
jgi:hypothetical protein